MAEEGIEDLLRRAAAGDPEAAGELTRRYEAPVKAAIRARLGRALRARLDTEDVFQSTILVSLRHLGGLEYRGDDALVGWMAHVAEQRIRDQARRHRASRRDLRRDRPLKEAADVAASLPSPSQAAARHEAARSLRDAVARLPAPDRQVVELHTFGNLDFPAIAKRLSLKDRHAARDVFRRALRLLEALLDGEGPGEEGR